MIKIRILLALGLIGLAGCGTIPPGQSYPYQGPLTTNGVPVVEPSFGSEWGVPAIECEWCGSAKDLNVHHIIPQHIAPELAHDKSNMIVLCRPCHFTLGHRCNWSSGGTTNITRMIEEGKR
jgi:hypothetical protein